MKRFSHIVNLGTFPPTSDLYHAQPITVETMRIAKGLAAGKVDVTLLSAQYGEDRETVPADFVATPDLDHSVLDVGEFRIKRKLPLVKDILDRAYGAQESDYLIFTNVDIGLLPSFYVTVDRLIDCGFDGIVINRRTIPKTYTKIEDIPLMFGEAGRPHMGYDCFIFRRDAYQRFLLGLTCVGAPYVGKAILLNQIVNSQKFKVFYDQHVTFHVGNDKAWLARNLRDYKLHNEREFNKIMAAQDIADRSRLRKMLSQRRKEGLRDRLIRLLGLD
jgi:hypothetical protein